MVIRREFAEAAARASLSLERGARISLLLAPALVPFLLVFAGAMAMVLIESFNVYVPGRIVHHTGSLTLKNYATFLSRSYAGFFLTTFRLGIFSALISVLLAYPIAYKIVRSRLHGFRGILIGAVVLSFFLSGIVRVVSLILMLSNGGLVNSSIALLGFPRVRLVGTETGVLIGLIHFLVPLAVLTLVGAIRNVDATWEDAAMGLGASKVRTFLRVTLPLSMPGVLGALALTFAGAVSAFVIPLFLGSGIVNMVSNLIYDRFADVLNFPEGAALAVILLMATASLTYLAGAAFGKPQGESS